ncbi:hypothetical protein [Nocardioides sp. InS609-2]|uniref:hypothetical protein n=1 Tax=Nocardioides sp. InS609-2 TaxID=2760705 RepID=UPI0020BEF9C4|nr:hypothetical protein [Nocardioides sp. InS609-2]
MTTTIAPTRPVSLPVSLVVTHVAERTHGGRRRSDADETALELDREDAAGRRADRDSVETVLVNAADAAELLARLSDFWDAAPLLAHAEFARLAVEEALQGLEAAEKSLGLVDLVNGNRRRVLAELQQRRLDLVEAIDALALAHRDNLVCGD